MLLQYPPPSLLSVCSLGCVQLTEPTETLLPGAGQGIESRRKRGCGKALRLCPRGRCCVNTLRWQRCMKHSLSQHCLLSRHLWIMNWFRLSVQYIYSRGGSISSIPRPHCKKAVVVLGWVVEGGYCTSCSDLTRGLTLNWATESYRGHCL